MDTRENDEIKQFTSGTSFDRGQAKTPRIHPSLDTEALDVTEPEPLPLTYPRQDTPWKSHGHSTDRQRIIETREEMAVVTVGNVLTGLRREFHPILHSRSGYE